MNFNNCGVIVPDVSFYQDDDTTPQGIDFAQMKAAGAKGVIIRAGQNSWLDPDFKTNWLAAKAAGLPRGSYWFYDSRTEPAKQANMWHAAIGYDLPELDLWADLEENYGGAYKTENHYKNFVLATQAFFPTVKVGIYTADWWWYDKVKQGIIRDDAFWKVLRLWVAQYHVDQSDVILPRPWNGQEPVFWQFTASGDGARFGVESKEIDLNYFNGDLAKFNQFFGVSQDDTQEGQTMYRYEATSIYRMSLRPWPSVDNFPITTIPAQSKMQGGELQGERGSGECWLKVIAVNGMVYDEPGWVAIEHGGRVYCSLVDNQPMPQPDFPQRIGYTLDGTTIRWYVPE